MSEYELLLASLFFDRFYRHCYDKAPSKKEVASFTSYMLKHVGGVKRNFAKALYNRYEKNIDNEVVGILIEEIYLEFFNEWDKQTSIGSLVKI
jgi:hypothetical protein